MQYKVRKGVETPCKIHGLFVNDFYIMFGCTGGSGAINLLNIKSLVDGSMSLSLFLLIFLSCVSVLLLLCSRFYKRAKKKKYRTEPCEIIISNRSFVSYPRLKQ